MRYGPELPGPRAAPLIGARGNQIAFLARPVDYMQRLQRAYGPVAALARGSSRYVFVFTPDHIGRLLGDTDTFRNLDAGSSPLRMPGGSALERLYAGLTNLNGADHDRHRALMSGPLHGRRLRGYGNEITALAERHVDGWRVGQLRDVYDDMRRLTLEIAVQTLLGLAPDREGERVRRLLHDWMALVFHIPALALPLDLRGLPYRRLLRVSVELDQEIRAMIAHRRTAAVDGDDVLSTLLQARSNSGVPLDEDELIGETAFLVMAGHATTASALAWTLFLLAQHPHVLSDVVEELDAARDGRAPLLDAAVKESMRLLPPVLWWSRVTARPCELAGHPLPAGARVAYSAYVTHRLPELYPDPERFVPGRWRDATPGPHAYLPFSAGPRRCLGSSFALMEIRLVLMTILRRFALALPDGARIDRGGLMLCEPRPGMPMVVGPPRRLPARPSLVRGNVAALV
jgi:cytochrome P450